MIRWQDKDAATVERAIKLLLREIHPDAQGIDGSGGDGGQDIRWISPDGLVIFEVKSYTLRLTSTQKRAIKRSLRNAATHKPVRWYLIVPLDPTPGEKAWFDELRTEHSNIALEWRGRDWIDNQFAQHEDLRRYVEGPDYALLARAREMNMETAVFADGVPDLAKRLTTLAARSDEQSPYWRFDFSVRKGRPTISIAERFPGAAAIDPIILKPMFSFPIDDPEAMKAAAEARRAFEYGGEATIDGRFIERFTVEASEESKRLLGAESDVTVAELKILSPKEERDLSLPLYIEAAGPDGTIEKSLVIQYTRRSGGSRGVTLNGSDVTGWLRAESVLDYPSSGRIDGRFNFGLNSAVGKWPELLRPVAEFVLAVNRGCHLTFRHGPGGGATFDAEPGTAEDLARVARVVCLIDDVQKAYGQPFLVPDIGPEDVQQLLMLKELAAEGRAIWPSRNISATIRPDRLHAFLDEAPLIQPGHFVIETGLIFDFSGAKLDIGRVRLVSSKMQLTNRAELEAAAGDDAPQVAIWSCVNEARIHISQMPFDV